MINFSKTLKKGAVSLLSVAVVAMPGLISPLAIQAQTLPPTVTAYSSISVKVKGVSFRKLYNFTTDLNNDATWFPNVASTVVLNGPTSKFSKVGTEYYQVSSFNGVSLNTDVKVTNDFSPYFYQLEGTGPVANYTAYYTFNPVFDGTNTGEFTLTTKFAAPGITKDALTYLITLAMQNILNHYNTTGDIHMNFIYIQ